jgi:hypothetical protein
MINKTQPQYEVEIRCHFNTATEAYKAMPFLRGCLTHQMVWSSSICGRELFEKGQNLRNSKTTVDGETKYYLGWKGPDTGTFANIREEIDEVITDGITGSRILNKLGSKKDFVAQKKVAAELKALGYAGFMSFRGHDSFGYYEPLGVSMKLLYCRVLRWPVMVEVEKSAESLKEAAMREKELRQFCDIFGLHERLVREEPPTLLYQTRFPGE